MRIPENGCDLLNQHAKLFQKKLFIFSRDIPLQDLNCQLRNSVLIMKELTENLVSCKVKEVN